MIVGFSGIMGAALLLHAPGLNGPFYWQWQWRELPLARTILVTLLCVLPALTGQVAFHFRRIGVATTLVLTALTVVLLQLGLSGINTPVFDLTRIGAIVVDPGATTYFTDAAKLVDHESVLASYPELLETQLMFHSRTKPPGPVVFYVALIRWLGLNWTTAFTGALFLALAAAAAVPASYFFFRSMGASDAGAVHGAAGVALCTGPIVFFPQFDQAYMVFTCLFLGLWCVALKRDRAVLSAACGGVLAVGLFFAYHLAVLGVFIVVSSLLWWDQDRSTRRLTAIAKHAAITLAVVAAFYIGLWLMFSFNVLTTFEAAISNQELMKAKFEASGHRIYPKTILPDFVDFALGLSWLPFAAAPLLMGMIHRRRGGDLRVGLGWLCLAQVVVVVISGQIAVETARVLIFLMPLFFFPIGLAMERWTLPERLAFLGSMALLLALNFRNMVFLSV
jgi:hypothetical protein